MLALRTWGDPLQPHQRLSRASLLAATLLAYALCAAWYSLETWRAGLAALILPHAAIGASICSSVLWLRQARAVRTMPLQIAAAGTAFALGVLGVCHWLYAHLAVLQMLPVPQFVRTQQIKPLAALLLMATAAALLQPMLRPSRKANDAATLCALASVTISSAFLLSALFGLLGRRLAEPSRWMLPGAAVCYLCLNVTILLQNPKRLFVRDFIGPQQGASLARRLVALSGAAICALALLRVFLQTAGLVSLEEGTALLATVAIVLLGIVSHTHGQLVARSLREQQESMAALHRATFERRDLLARLQQERCHLDNILRAASGFSIIGTDLCGNINFFTQGAQRLLGYSAAETVGKMSMLDLHVRKELHRRALELGLPDKESFDIFRALAQLGLRDEREWTYCKKDGSIVPVWLSVTTVTDTNGAIVGYLGVARDITADKRVQRERDSYLKISHELLCIATTDSVLLSVSPAFTRVLGYAPSDLVGEFFGDYVHEEDQDSTAQATRYLSSGLQIQRFVNRWRAKDGRYRYVSWDASVSPEDGLIYAGGWDITEEKMREQQALQHAEFEQHLIGIVSHDLRNPLSAIAMLAQLAEKNCTQADKVGRYAKRIAEACRRAERMVHDILDYTQARLGGGLQVRPAPIDLPPLLQKTIDEVQLAHADRSIVLQAPVCAPLLADADRIAQLLGNLLANGLKYSPADSQVIVRLQQHKEALRLEVQNGGTPIAPELLPHLFKPMQRGAAAGNNTGHNIGLGLFIVHEVVRAHQGSISVSSDAESGTTVRVDFPIGPPSRPRAQCVIATAGKPT